MQFLRFFNTILAIKIVLDARVEKIVHNIWKKLDAGVINKNGQPKFSMITFSDKITTS